MRVVLPIVVTIALAGATGLALSRGDDVVPSCRSVPDVAIDSVGQGHPTLEAAIESAVEDHLLQVDVGDLHISPRSSGVYVVTSGSLVKGDRIIVSVRETADGFIPEGAYCA
jgi:hypothetical protein